MQQAAVKILDERKFHTKLFWADLVALGLLLVAGSALFIEMYYFGWSGYLAQTSQDFMRARDIQAVRMIGEAILLTVALVWLAYRVIRGGYQAISHAGR